MFNFKNHQQIGESNFFGTLTNEKTTTRIRTHLFGRYNPKEKKELNPEPSRQSGLE
jgi:hypothetical protein